MARGGARHQEKRFASRPDEELIRPPNHRACSGCDELFKPHMLRRFPDEAGVFCFTCHGLLIGVFVPLEARSGSLNSYYKATYQLTFREYAQRYLAQQGRCLICQIVPEERRLVVDHCHVDGQVRGLLCGTCNSGLGMFRDSIPALARAIVYLSD